VIETSLARIAEVVGGKVVGTDEPLHVSIQGAEFDSRRVKSGQLFVALGGAQTHGHHFVATAKGSGAVAALVEDSKFLIEAGLPGVVVQNSLFGMQQLAAWWRTEVGLPVLAITGSVGKTTTKELAATILSCVGPGTSSQASFNNHVGVPYTLLQISRADQWAVIEIGMNHRGEIAPLSEITAPNVAAITFIAPAHIGNLGSLHAIAEEKLDIAQGLKPGAPLLLNTESELLADTELLRQPHVSATALKYFGPASPEWRKEGSGMGIAPTLELRSATPSPDGLTLDLKVGGNSRTVTAPLFGTHHRSNVGAALLGALTLIPRLSLDAALAAVSRFQLPDKRFVRRKARGSGAEILDDSYNANPASMRAFFDATRAFTADKPRWGIVLGEMRELGAFERDYHIEIAEFVLALKPSFVVAVGMEGAKFYEETFKASGFAPFVLADDAASAVPAVGRFGFELLLVKGARGVKLERLIEAIAEPLP
jgi:UDP-N-acetylmuramoyl-tripeptide--D-alanyl-D-alanine ligase